MGRPKLLLPLAGSTVIGRLLSVLARPEIAETVVVIRLGDESLRAAVEAAGAAPLVPAVAPAEMRVSVEHALRHLQQRHEPCPDDGWLLAPADHPLLDPMVLDRIIAAWRRSPDKIVIPAHKGKRGHPAVFPFRLADEVFRLAADEGLNALVRRHAREVEQIDVDSPAVVVDLDTPEDYQRLQADRTGSTNALENATDYSTRKMS